MSSIVSKNEPPPLSGSENNNNINISEDQEESNEKPISMVVTSHLYLKPSHSSGTLDKDVVLRRIRHRKRVNKVRSAVQTLLSSPFTANSAEMRWVDDAFAAP